MELATTKYVKFPKHKILDGKRHWFPTQSEFSKVKAFFYSHVCDMLLTTDE